MLLIDGPLSLNIAVLTKISLTYSLLNAFDHQGQPDSAFEDTLPPLEPIILSEGLHFRSFHGLISDLTLSHMHESGMKNCIVH